MAKPMQNAKKIFINQPEQPGVFMRESRRPLWQHCMDAFGDFYRWPFIFGCAGRKYR
jgi:hypothetical protein